MYTTLGLVAREIDDFVLGGDSMGAMFAIGDEDDDYLFDEEFGLSNTKDLYSTVVNCYEL